MKAKPILPPALSRAEIKKPSADLILLDFTPYDLIQTLEQLHEMAVAGQINGLVLAAKYSNPGERRHLFMAAGRLSENPDEALGVASLLQAEMAARAVEVGA